jgi:hypothetical protein
MSTTAVPAAPAQDAPAPVTISATKDAATRGDFAAFERAEAATRDGKPLAAVEVPSSTDTPAAPDRRPNAKPAAAAQAADAAPDNRKTREQKEQDRINESIRTATEAATASLRAEITDLRTQLGARPPAAAVEPKKGDPEWKRFQAMPDAPKLDEFDSVADHTAAMSFFIAKAMLAEERSATQATTAQERAQVAQQERFDGFQTRIAAAKEKDPDWGTKLSAEVRALKPYGALAQGEKAGPSNALAEEIVDSPISDQILLHLSAHGDELTRLITMPEAIARMGDGPAQRRAHREHIAREFARLEGRLMSTAVAPGASAQAEVVVPSPVSKAPPPADTITRARSTTDPREAALTKGDFAAFDAIEVERERSKRAAR